MGMLCLSLFNLPVVGAIAIAMGCSPVIFAEDTTTTTQLDPIVVTASKAQKKRVKFRRVFL